MDNNMKFRILAFLLVCMATVANAQNESFKGDRFIEVTGTVQQEIEPNEIYLVIRLREFEENRQKTNLEKIEKDFFKALSDAGIDRKRLELADAGSRLANFRRRDKEAFREKTYQLKVTSAGELEKVVEKLEAVKVDFLDIARVSHSDLEKLKVELKTKALLAAKNKAEYLLKAIGAEVGKPLMVRDWEIDPIHPMENQQMNYMRKQEAMEEIAPEQPQIGFRKIRLQAQVVAQFEIK